MMETVKRTYFIHVRRVNALADVRPREERASTKFTHRMIFSVRQGETGRWGPSRGRGEPGRVGPGPDVGAQGVVRRDVTGV